MNHRPQGYVHATEDVEKKFTAMMDTYLDSITVPAEPNCSELPELQHPDLARSQQQQLNGTADMSEHARALSSFVGPCRSDMSNQAGLFCQDADLFGLGMDEPDIVGTARGQGGMISAISSANIPGSLGAPGAAGGHTGKEGDRKQKILEKNRRAQKRFREKQKTKMVDMEVALQELKSTLCTSAQEKTCLQRQNESLLKVLELRQSQIEVLSEVAKVDPDGLKPDLRQEMRSTAGALSTQLESGLTLDTCRVMSPTNAISHWRQYVERLTSILVEAEMPTAPESCHTSLRQAATHASKFSHVLAIVNPHAIKILMNSNLETGEFEPDPSRIQGDVRSIPAAFWTETIDVISLSQDQKDKILYLASMLVRSIKSCHSQREVLTRKLTQLLPQTFGTSGNVGATCSATDTMSELHRNFQSEHMAWTTFVTGVVVKILSHRQFARLCSRCYPFFPRTFQIARHLAKGKDILEFTGLPGLLLPVGFKTAAHEDWAGHVASDKEGDQDNATASGKASDAKEDGSPCGYGSRKSQRIAQSAAVPQEKSDR